MYLAIGGAVLILMSLGMYYVPASQMKIPAFLLGIVGGVGVGAAVAIIGMMGFGWRWYAQYYENQNPRMGSGGSPPAMGVVGGGPPAAGGGSGQRGGRQRGSADSNSKNQLASLITKLDLLTHERPVVQLDAEQKRQIRKQIEKLDDKEDLSEEEAKKKLDAMVGILHDDQKKILSEAGANLPGQQGGNRGRGEAPPNPFKEGQPNQHLKSLSNQLEDKKTD
ncbi:MAG TPA: hypothetical protein VE999_11370 [Gemmataceae bacterium]|nr:hypothetical protein [Gemmataceae bacterium]